MAAQIFVVLIDQSSRINFPLSVFGYLCAQQQPYVWSSI